MKIAKAVSFSQRRYAAGSQLGERTKSMEREDVRARLDGALARLVAQDAYLFANNLGERCIVARLAMYLQHEFPEHHVDAEYNRDADEPKQLDLPDECANYVDENGDSLVVPDVIVHLRGPDGPNILVLEVKKTTNPAPLHCDSRRIHAFRAQYGYEFGALIVCETRTGHAAAAQVVEFLPD
jgi:hypothetical protein